MKEFDIVFTHKPANKTASIVLQKGENYQYSNKLNDVYCSTIPPEYKKFTGPEKDNKLGTIIGDLVVTGYIGRGAQLGRWALRCNCGNYIILSKRAIEKKAREKCDDCHKAEYYRREII